MTNQTLNSYMLAWGGVHTGFGEYCSNLYAEHIMRNARLGELQAGIKIGNRNINNLSYVNDTTLMEQSKEELKNLLMRVKEERERTDLKLNIKTKQN